MDEPAFWQKWGLRCSGTENQVKQSDTASPTVCEFGRMFRTCTIATIVRCVLL